MGALLACEYVHYVYTLPKEARKGVRFPGIQYR